MRHGGTGGGGSGENPTTQLGMGTAAIPFIALWGLLLMPVRWPAASRRVLLYALLATPFFAGMSNGLMSGWGVLFVMVAAWHISHKYMTHEHYKPSRRSVQQRQADDLASIAHLRSRQAWHEHYIEHYNSDGTKKGTS